MLTGKSSDKSFSFFLSQVQDFVNTTMEHVILWVNDTQSRVSDTILLHFKSAASLAKARKKDDQRTSKGQPV